MAKKKLPLLKRQLYDTERRVIIGSLAENDGNATLTAKKLGVSRRTLYYRCEKLGIDPDKFRPELIKTG